MSSDTKKTVRIIALTASALLINIIPLLEIMLEKNNELWSFSPKWLREIGFFRWGWFFSLCFAGYALKEVQGWNVAPKPLKVLVVTGLIFILILSIMWSLLLLIAANLPT